MDKIGIGILGASEIALRKFLPALELNKNFKYMGVGIASLNERNKVCENKRILLSIPKKSKFKAENIMERFGGGIFNSYEELLSLNGIKAVYIPLPPALHYYWAKKALKYGKHVLLEKPFTTSLRDTADLIKIANKNKLALHENYAFAYHNQMNKVYELINKNEIGEIRQIRTAFGFPYRGNGDFRYKKELGGGALLDCGGYPIKLATLLLGETAEIKTSKLNMIAGYNVDIFGSATLENNNGITAQVSFGMDNLYKCEMEIWGSKGVIYAPRIFTAPANIKPSIVIKKEVNEIIEAPMMDQFLESINHFHSCIIDQNIRSNSYKEIIIQSEHIENVLKADKRGVL